MSRKGFITFLSSLPLSHVKRTPVHLLLLLAGWLVAGSSLAQTTVEYIHTDALGSVVAVTNEAGQVIERFDYEPYGAIIGKPDYGGVGFTGHVQDAATGLTYMQQRYYDPVCGCFLSVDPVTAYSSGDWRQFNRYAYAFNNPYRFTDPDGRQSWSNTGTANSWPAVQQACGGSNSCEQEVAGNLAEAEAKIALTAYGGTTVPGLLRAIAAPFVKEAIAGQQSTASAPKGDLHAPGDASDGTVIVRGGTGDMPAPGTTFSGSQGGTVTEAGAGVPHGTIRTSTAGEIRSGGGRVEVAPEPTRGGQINGQHVNVTEGGRASTFSPPQPNPVPKVDRIK